MTVTFPFFLMVLMCYLTVLQFMDANLFGVMGMGALTLAIAMVVWDDAHPKKRRSAK